MIQVHDFEDIRALIDGQLKRMEQTFERRLDELLDKLANTDSKATREVYYVKDICELTGFKADTVRKNYIATGVIRATTPAGRKQLEISPIEYQRLRDQWDSYGRLF
jgi:hypothetical protein